MVKLNVLWLVRNVGLILDEFIKQTYIDKIWFLVVQLSTIDLRPLKADFATFES